jgi:hypothetical protein
MQKAALWQMVSMLLQAFAIFLTGFALLHSAETAHYALFALSQVVQGTANGVVNALCASPLLLLMNSAATSARAGSEPCYDPDYGAFKSYGIVALAIAVTASVVQFVLAFILDWPLASALTIALGCGILTFRWYLRAVAQNFKQGLLVVSDLILALVQLLGLVGLFAADSLNLFNITMLLLLSAIFSCLPYVAIFIANFTGQANWPGFQTGYQQQGRPALSGMISVELATNFHSYAIVLLAGATAFAPIAAAAMFLRPMTIVQNSLVQYFRPHLVRQLTTELTNKVQIRLIVSHILQASVGAWLLNVAAIGVVAFYAINWLWPDPSTSANFLLAFGLTCGWYLLRSLRIHTSAVLQAADCFTELARVTWISSAMLVPLVLTALMLGSPVLSIVGAIISELWIVVRLQQLTHQLYCFRLDNKCS